MAEDRRGSGDVAGMFLGAFLGVVIGFGAGRLIFGAYRMFEIWDCGASDCDTWAMQNTMLWFLLALLAAFVGGALGSVAWRMSGRRVVQGAVVFVVGVPAVLWVVAVTTTPPWE